MNSRRRIRATSSIGVIALILGVLIVLNRQYITDQFDVWTYSPASDIVSLATRSGMSPEGRFYFYASQPVLDNAQNFSGKCGKTEASTAILGCYTAAHIYLYDVSNAQLDGIREVTAAHEMLHAAYDRMGKSERTQVDTLVEAEYATLKNDKTFAQRMTFYDKTEPGERDNELHSIIGTEVPTISPALEAHYKAYFSDRSLVTALHTKYAAVFANVEAEGQQLTAQLNQLGNTIDADSTTYNAQVSQLNIDVQAFNAKASSNGGFKDDAEFQTARATLLARADQLSALRTTINTDVAQYASLKQELQSVSSQSDTLNRSIDSNLAPAPSV